jgi:hypothetical protein
MQVYAKAWKAQTLSAPQELNREILVKTLLAESGGIRIAEFYSPEACERVVAKLCEVARTDRKSVV